MIKPTVFIFLLVCSFQITAQSVIKTIGNHLKQQPNIEISLGKGMLSLLSEMSKEQSETAKVIQKLKQIEVRVYELEEQNGEQIELLKKIINNTAKQLKQNGLEQLAALREQDGLTFIMAKMNEQKINGISIMALDDDSELIIIEINGNIQLKDLGLLMKKFGLDLD